MGRGTDAAVTVAQSVFTTEGGAGARSMGRKGWGAGRQAAEEGTIINGGAGVAA